MADATNPRGAVYHPPPSGLRVPDGPARPVALGVVVPFDMALDHELWRWTPDGVTLLFTRTPYSSLPVTVEMVRQLGEVTGLQNAVQDLLTACPRAFAYACTAASFVDGVAGERRLVEAMQQAASVVVLTTSGAIVSALHLLGARRVAVATPYDEQVTGRLGMYLWECGLEVVSSAQLGLHGGIWQVPYTTTAELVLACDSQRADAVVVACTNLPTYDLIGPLEEELGKPVVTANQATMWASMRALGRAAVGPGQRLLAQPDAAGAGQALREYRRATPA